MTNQKKLLLIDGSSVAFRAFFALYNQIDRFRNNNGLHTNAIYGFHLMLDNLLERIQPTHVLVAFDAGKTTFRTEMFADYKAGRAKTPEEFREQFPYIREMLAARGIAYYDLAQYEADDIIGTLAKMAENTSEDYQITVVSGDKDLIQLLMKILSLRFRRKVWLSLRPSHLTTSWRKWGLLQRNSSTSRPSWVISPIIFQGLLRLVKRLVSSSSWNTVPLKVSMSILMR